MSHHDELIAAFAGEDDDARGVLFPRESIMRHHLDWLVAPVRGDRLELRLEIAWGKPDDGPNCAKTFRLDALDSAVSFAAWINAKRNNTYVGVTLKQPDTPEKGRTCARHAALTTAIPIDIDGAFLAGAHMLGNIAKPQLVVETGRTPELRGQLWLRIEPTDDMTLWSEVNRRTVAFCGGDANALGTYRVMRLAGSINYPSSKKQARGYAVESTALHTIDAPSFRIRELIEAFPPAPTPCGGSVKQRHSSRAHRPLPLNRVNVALVSKMLDALPGRFASEFDLWLRVGFSLYEFDRGDIGLALWRRFSQRCADKARGTNFDKRWLGFDRNHEGPRLTVGWLVSQAEAHGYRMPRAWDFKTTIAADEGTGR